MPDDVGPTARLTGLVRYQPDPRGLAGDALRRARERLGVQPADFAEAISAFCGRAGAASERVVEMWEAGTPPPPGDVLIIAGLLAPTEPGESLWTIDGGRLEAMRRREFMLGAFGVAMAADLEPWERLAGALSRPSRIDQRTVDHLERVAVALERLEPQADPRTLLGAVKGHLETVTFLLENPLRPSVRQQLCSIAAETAGVAGRMRWILDDDAGADAYYRVGMEAAREAGDTGLGAYLMGKAACRPFYREVPQARLRGLTGALGFCQSDATPRTRAWLAMLAAEAHALAGAKDACLHALERARFNLGRARAEECPRPRISFFDGIWLAGQNGACLAHLGKLEDARAELSRAIAALDPTWAKQRTWLLVMLAGTFVKQQAPEDACRVGAEALASAARVGAVADLQLVRGLSADLKPWGMNPAVQEFRERVRVSTA